MADDRLKGPRAKIERAKEHVYDLASEIKAYAGRYTHEILKEVDPNTGQKIFRLRVREKPPERMSLILGDAIHNLRSALDLLACQLVLVNGGTVTEQTGFPIHRGAKEFEAGAPAKVKGASKDAFDLIRTLKPYKGGNDALWRLHRLDIADKHHLILAVGAAYHSFILQPELQVPWQDEPVKFPPIGICPNAESRFPLKDGDILLAITSDDDQEPQFIFGVAFGEGEVVEGEPLIPTLNQLGGAIEEMVELFAPLL